MAKSTKRGGGPKTDAGKGISSQNSTKHGLTSVKLISEDEAENYQHMVTLLIEEHEPNGITEEQLVNDIAMMRIRLSRFDTVENALFSIEQENIDLETYMKKIGIHDSDRQPFRNHLTHNTNFSDDYDEEDKSWCKQIMNQVDETKPISEKIKELIKAKIREESYALNTDPDGLYRSYWSTSSGVEQYEIPETEEELKERDIEIEHQISKLSQRNIISFVNYKLSALERIETNQKILESLRKMKRLMHDAALPEQKDLDRIYRYKTTLERQLLGKLSQLIQLQDVKARKAQMKALNAVTS